MAKTGKTSAGVISSDYSLKSRGMKNPYPQGYNADEGSGNVAHTFKGNDGSSLNKGGKAAMGEKKEE